MGQSRITMNTPEGVHLPFSESKDAVVEKEAFPANHENESEQENEVEDAEEGGNEEGDEEEIADQEKRAVSEMMEEHDINCDAVEDTIQERNTSMYVQPSEESDSSEADLSNMHFDQGFNRQNIQRVNQQKHHVRDCQELNSGMIFAS